ncbi:MAG: hypothetical protein H6868_04180 [Rhodospirillales bacterium]|nr:hypothetical protein [Rhodospirillales bacterium]
MTNKENEFDEFADDEISGEDEFFEDDDFEEEEEGDWDDDLEEGDLSEGQPASPKKKSSRFNLIVFGIAGVVALVVVASMMGGGGQAPAPQNANSEQNAAKDMAVEEEPDGGFFNDPEALDRIGMPPENEAEADDTLQDDPLPMPTPTQMTQSEDETPLLPLPNNIETATAAPADNGYALQDVGTDSMALVDSASAPVPVAAPAAQPAGNALASSSEKTSPPAASGSMDEQFSALFDRLDQLESRLDEIKDTAASSAQLDTLKDSVNALEKKVARLESRKPASAAETAPKAPKAAPSSAAAPTAAPKIAAPSSTKWTLKSALPGEAYVAADGASDMVHVRVGDTLPGIGTVKGIYISEGKWIIEGTSGKVTQ